MVIGNDNSLSINAGNVEKTLAAGEVRDTGGVDGIAFGQILDATVDGIFSIDTQGRFLYVNRAFAQILGKSAGELIGLRSDTFNIHFTATQENTFASTEIELTTPQGNRHFEYTLNPVSSHNGTTQAFAGVIRDIEERRQAEQQYNTFLGLASHELRTPLAAIKGNVQLALRQVKRLMKLNLSDVNEFANKIEGMLIRAERQTDVEARMVNDMLDVSRVQNNRLEIHLHPLDLIELVTNVVANERAAEQTRIVHLTLPAQESIMVLANTDRIEQVLLNFLSNAFKYAPPEKPIEVAVEVSGYEGTSRESGLVRVSIQDEGPGLTPEEQQHVWERFYQTPNRTVLNGQSTGLGLGLYICKILMERQRGTAGVESKQGQGATFWFELPIASS